MNLVLITQLSRRHVATGQSRTPSVHIVQASVYYLIIINLDSNNHYSPLFLWFTRRSNLDYSFFVCAEPENNFPKLAKLQ